MVFLGILTRHAGLTGRWNKSSSTNDIRRKPLTFAKCLICLKIPALLKCSLSHMAAWNEPSSYGKCILQRLWIEWGRKTPSLSYITISWLNPTHDERVSIIWLIFRRPASTSHNDAPLICTQKVMLFRPYFGPPQPPWTLDITLNQTACGKHPAIPYRLSFWPSLAWFDQKLYSMKHAVSS